MEGRVVRYSEAFKLKVVGEVEKGRFSGPFEAASAYGIGQANTVQRWMLSYGKGHLLKKVIRVEEAGEPGEIARLQKRVRQLEEALADAHVEERLGRAYFEILCERTHTDPEAFKKKSAGELSIGRRDLKGGGT